MGEARSGGMPGQLSGLNLGARDPKRLTRSDLDAAVLHAAGLGDLANRLWRDGASVSNAARRSVTAHLRADYGARDPHRGAILLWVFVLLLLSALPLGMLGGIRLGIENTEAPGAVVSVVVGVGVLVAVLSAGGRPLGRPVALQSTLLAGLLVAAAGIGAGVTDGWVRAASIVGAALAVIAAVIVRIVRARGGDRTRAIDNAVEIAHLDVAAEVSTERERLSSELALALATRTDLAELRRRRSAAIAAIRAQGGADGGDDPDLLPGGFIIAEQTMLWLPLHQQTAASRPV